MNTTTTGQRTVRDGLDYHGKGDLDQALAIYREVLEREPNNPDALHLSGIVHLDRRQFDEAEKLIRRAVEIKPNSSRYNFSMGNLFRIKEQPNLAIEYYNKTIALQPDFADIYNNKAVALLMLGKLAEGMECCEKAIQLNPDHFTAMSNLGVFTRELSRQRFKERFIPGGLLTEAQAEKVPYELRKADYLYCPQYRFLYAPIPKVACSSFKMILYKTCKADIPELIDMPTDRIDRNFHIIIDRCFCLAGYSDLEAKSILGNKEIFKFTVVRNPFDRIASAFLNKFVTERSNPAQWEHTLPVIEKVFGPDQTPATTNITFRQFIQYLSANTELDKHWFPMFLMVDPFDMDMVIRMENLKADFEVLRDRLQLPYDLPHMNKSSRKDLDAARGAFADYGVKELSELPALPTTAQMYDESLEKLLHNRYKQDFEMFGYSDKLNVN